MVNYKANIFISFWPVSVFPQRAHNWLVEFQSQNRGHINTRLCPFILFKLLIRISCLRLLPVTAYLYVSYYSLSPYPPHPSAPTAALAPARSSLSCFHHLLENHAIGVCTVSSHSSIIVRLVIYCATLFFLFRTYSPISSSPASSIVVSSDGYSQLPSAWRFGFLQIIHLSTLCWNSPRDRPMQGVITHVSNTNRSTAYTTALKNILGNLGMAPLLPIVLVIRYQLFRAFGIFPTNSVQLLSDSFVTRPKYLKDVTVLIGPQ